MFYFIYNSSHKNCFFFRVNELFSSKNFELKLNLSNYCRILDNGVNNKPTRAFTLLTCKKNCQPKAPNIIKHSTTLDYKGCSKSSNIYFIILDCEAVYIYFFHKVVKITKHYIMRNPFLPSFLNSSERKRLSNLK